MKRSVVWCISLVVGACLLVRANADPALSELGIDLRNRLVSTGHSYPDIYSLDLRTEFDAAPGYRVSIEGERRYNKNLIQQAQVETGVSSGLLRAGLVRVPFGIYDTRETYSSGIINYPLVRNDYGHNSVDWGAPGAVWVGGSPKIQAEAAGFDGVASGDWNNKDYAGGGAVRVQTYTGGVILGLSRWDGYLSVNDQRDDREVVQLDGVDWRYTLPQMVIRGEYQTGILAGDHERGWYTDIYYRLPNSGRWTAVGRVEEFKPALDESTGRQVTAGMRYVVSPGWNLAANWVSNNGAGFFHESWMRATKHDGDWYFQMYRTITF